MATSENLSISLNDISHLIGDHSGKFVDLANYLPQICWMTDSNGMNMWYNKQWYEYTGLVLGNCTQTDWQNIVHPQDRARTVEVWGNAIVRQIPFEINYRLKDANGQYRWFLAHGTPVYGSNKVITSWIGTCTDIDSHRKAQAEIMDLMESIDEGFLSLDKNWIITQVNSRHEEISKVPRKTQLGSNFLQLYFSNAEASQTEYWKAYHKAMKERVICKFEDYYPPLGVWTAVSVYPKADGGLAIFYRDITLDKRRQYELVRAKEESERTNKMKSSFLTNMSHEIRTPLASIMGYSELLKDDDLAAEDRHRFLSMIVRNGSNLSRIIDDILDLSKVESGHLELDLADISLDQLTHEVLSMFRAQAKAKNVYLSMKIDSNVPKSIKTDAARLRQILVNLIGNAIKFTSEGGITVRVKAEAASTNHMNFVVQVADTGIGISYDQRQRLFKPFTQADSSTTRKYGGTGLGLTLSKKLAQALKGDLRIAQSEVGRGTTFELRFQAEALVDHVTWSRNVATRLESRIDLNHLNILLAEDAPDSQELIKYVLTTHGANVQVASNGAEALKLARENKYDVVLMDVQMPELDGYEVTRTLRAEHFNQPIIALTAHAMAEERKKSQAAGCDCHMTKPLDFSQLLSTVKEITAAH